MGNSLTLINETINAYGIFSVRLIHLNKIAHTDQCRSAAVPAVPSETLGSSPGSVREVHGAMHNWPSVVRVREGLAGRDILVSPRYIRL